MIHPWMQPAWTRLVELGERLPHALLFVGPPGLGKRELAEALAARLLCDAPAADGHACGGCEPCQWRLAGNHPDLHRVVPAADAAADGAEGEGADAKEAGAKEGKAKSEQILIEQIRELQSALSVTGHHSARRVVVLDPAEAMNVFTANALLKMLEEPPAGCVFLLVSSAPRRLLPTIRSRCQQWPFSRPGAAALAQWQAGASPSMQALLAIGGGMPLAAERMAQRGGGALLERFVRDISGLQAADALRVAGQWDVWLKSKEALGAGFGLPELADWMQRWVSDLATVRLGGAVRFFPAQEGVLSALASRASIAAVGGCYNEITQIRKVSRHPLNLRLVLEDMLLRYARAISGARG
ncbi:DNA polymerase III subunit delta' [Thauera linaloolentis]|uniref:DNA polymerase III subunit delta n=1 Tax=Thauera linaloolentis (strain DSM 12138 / JCM 21573 / CCUG 41526 / CIP 105981 / IAM 15112 / NBRC 102519 / 47Lol) TaxID=1123367 RepID=N6Z4S6_THAL4|nr:DNA polymerase III subunit delta' [Thauera linaloolentis]ENO89582.1 DNA polymerase III subunit delta' [Thauera linaloolentis 47Lol = DSM 12138]MCM8565900.1 DNA polymerase III subunit delta' [Thauera linaloolentis]